MLQRYLRTSGFSLVEVVLALGIVSFAFLVLVALLSVGLRAEKESIEQSTASAIALKAESKFPSTSSSFAAALQNGPVYFYYDHNGIDEVQGQANATALSFFRVTIQYSILDSYPSNVFSSQMLAAVVTVQWPVAGGTLVPNAQSSIFTTYVPKYTDTSW